MKESIDKIELLLTKFTYEELNEVDRNFVNEVIGSKEAYDLLRKSTLQAQQSGVDLIASSSMKADLVKQFKRTHGKGISSPALGLFTRKVPAYYMMLFILLVSIPFIYLLSQGQPVAASQVTYIEVPGATDTLYVSLPPDTIVTERVVRFISPPNRNSML